ncbi:YncE family protein [Dysgonomonas sp. GY617]|uniref:YncE family protein n=1 Tax=Dysgonomonas sp. GY617 TaxID=2780420 RepID=UPI0018844BBA|nr:DUF5074 domain-containing protein [Dysgonomonas sp. GY617]MBF0575931.1 hypothetical protein [Dysgonomonas sp. GY617]
MNYKNLLFRSMLLTLSTLFLASCSSDDEVDYDVWTPPLSSTQGAFILNSGNQGSNNASLAFYDKETKKCNPTVFQSLNNGLELGDTAQDLIVSGDSIYIAMYGSGLIYVTNIQGKLVKKIVSERDGKAQKPRNFASDNKYVYVTYFDGYVARIERKTLLVDATQVKVGNNPENLKIANNKIYVANSGGMNYPNYDKTVSVIDIATFSKVKDIEVVLNPTTLEIDRRGNVYVISMGNYGDVPNTLQRINPNYSVDSLGNATLMKINPTGDRLYTIYAQYGAPTVDYKVYHIYDQKYVDGSFVNSDVKFSASPSTLDFDPATKEIYIGTSDYRTNAEMYIISTTGKLVSHFNTGGLNPAGAFFIK